MAGLERNIRPANALQRFGSNTDRGLRDLRVGLPFGTPRVGLQATTTPAITSSAVTIVWADPTSSPGPLEYDAPDVDGSLWDSGAPTRVTVQRAGLYHVSLDVLATSLTGFLTVYVVTSVGGTVRLLPVAKTTSNVAGVSTGFDLPLAEGEFVEVDVDQSSGSGGALDTAWTFLAVRLVSVDTT